MANWFPQNKQKVQRKIKINRQKYFSKAKLSPAKLVPAKQTKRKNKNKNQSLKILFSKLSPGKLVPTNVDQGVQQVAHLCRIKKL